ncbi:MAG: response regulator [Candidatus Obscuribacterales bacterium]|nr:response regulator [Candidatus Obscuribacterales bacterium]
MPSILVCEPQVDLEAAMLEYLVAAAFTVTLERNGMRALGFLRRQVFDIVAVEMALASLDGLGVIRAYRAAGGCSPVIILTGRISTEELSRAIEAGATAHLEKPFLLTDLLLLLKSLLSKSIATNKLYY